MKESMIKKNSEMRTIQIVGVKLSFWEEILVLVHEL